MKKQRRLLAIMSLFAGLFFTSCGEDKKQEEVDEVSAPMQNEMHKMDEEEIAEVDQGFEAGDLEFKTEEVAAVFENYNELKKALVASDADAAASAADDLGEALRELEIDGPTLEAAQAIAEVEELSLQRQKLPELTAGIEALITENIVSGKVYKQFCPMAFEGKGATWLSATEEVRNPYYGAKMLKCGSTREVIQ